MKKNLLLCASLFFGNMAFAKNETIATNHRYPSPSFCDAGVQEERITLKQIQGNGIGYNTGYTSLDLFLGKSTHNNSLVFLDARGHLLNNRTWATNAGLGMRWLATESAVLGMNAYYDYRKTKHFGFNQIALGLEALGSRWEGRVNGYLPVGKKNRLEYQVTAPNSVQGFVGNYLYIGQSRVKKFEYPLAKIDSELGAHLYPRKARNFDLYLGAGPYYLQAHFSKAIFGGAARAALTIARQFTFTGTYSYDHTFGSIGQGEFAINIPFGGKKSLRNLSAKKCYDQIALNQRFVQDVYREEIIPVKHHYQRDVIGQSLAIDPATGLPYFFVFVNNTSHSLGTFESPFPTLALAQANSSPRNIIYVYPGNGTTSGMDAGIVLQDFQQLWGSGIDQTLTTTMGDFIVSAETPGVYPLMTNLTANTPVVTLGNNNTVSGISATLSPYPIFNVNNACILISGKSNCTITNNILDGGYSGINSVTSVGAFTISGNTIRNSVQGLSISNSGNTLVLTANIMNNSFTNIGSISGSNPGFGIQCSAGNGARGTYVISGNTITNVYVQNGGAIAILSNGSNSTSFHGISAATVTNNIISGVTAIAAGNLVGNGIEFRANSNGAASAPGAIVTGTIANNTVTGSNGPASSGAIKVGTQRNSGFGLVNCSVSNNTIQNNAMPGIYVVSPPSGTGSGTTTGTVKVQVTNNTLSGNQTSQFVSQSPIVVNTNTVCVGLAGNTSDQAYNFLQSGSNSVLNLESPTGNLAGVQALNTGTITNSSGTITYVAPGTCQ